MKSCGKVFAGTLLACAVAVSPASVLAADAGWPTKPIRVVVPFAAGGGTDNIARALGLKLTETFGQQFIIDNRAGAGGTIGAEVVARANPDGYTLSMVSASYSANPALYKLPYDPVKGITPINLLAVGPLVLIGNPKVQASNLKELITAARAKPNSLTYGSTGVGSLAHLVGAMFNQMSGTEMLHVPYKGAPPAMLDLLAGQVALTFATAPSAVPYVKSGRLRALGVSTVQRISALPAVPTIAEAGVPGFEAAGWNGLVGPAGMPQPVAEKLAVAVTRIVKEPTMANFLRDQGADPATMTPQEFGAYIKSEMAKWSKVVKISGAKID